MVEVLRTDEYGIWALVRDPPLSPSLTTPTAIARLLTWLWQQHGVSAATLGARLSSSRTSALACYFIHAQHDEEEGKQRKAPVPHIQRAAFIAALQHTAMPIDAQLQVMSRLLDALHRSISLHAQLLACLITSHGWSADRDHHACVMRDIIDTHQLDDMASHAPVLQALAAAWREQEDARTHRTTPTTATATSTNTCM